MSQKTIVTSESYVPTIAEMEKVDDNFDELYAGTGITLTEYADNAAAVSGGLAVGDLYTTVGAVKVVTA